MHCAGAGLQGEKLISPLRRLSRETDACRHPRVSGKSELLQVVFAESYVSWLQGWGGGSGRDQPGKQAPGMLGQAGGDQTQGRRTHRNHQRFVKLKRQPWELPWWLSGKESTCQCRRHVFDP